MRDFFRKAISYLSFYKFNNLSNLKSEHKKLSTYLEKKIKDLKSYKNIRTRTHIIFNKNVIDVLKNKKLINFLRQPFIQKMFFTHNRLFIYNELRELREDKKKWNRWKNLLNEDTVGDPIRYFLYLKSSGNRIRQVYHLKKFTDYADIDVKSIKNIIEVGGGYGCMARIFSKINRSCNYLIFDTEEVNYLQYYYLKLNKLNVKFETIKANFNLTKSIVLLKRKLLTNNGNSLFIANWSISEMPLKLREKILKYIFNVNYILLSFQDKFENINNIKYFKKIKIDLEKRNFNVEITPIKHYNNAIFNTNKHYYLFAKKRSI
jgi:putative sugar O-methyltransferase